ncbi:hypothetical protein PLICRDRAFT_241926 [Plicaturopsis crispa FD-325 SS-3]|nr:hypothetical protein PLICRDRAFT_241926 [Plicaturopsis crispa FD-325 SS-3]
MASTFGFVKRVYSMLNPPVAPKNANALKFGIIGAADIAPLALIAPAKSHPDVVIHAIAARDLTRAQAFAKKHGIPKAYGGYQELLDDPEIDVVYNPLPNSLHFEWTMKALAAGKHVLLEKPSADVAEDTRAMFAFAESKGLVLLEAFHYRFHPAIQRVKKILDSGELGAIKNIEASIALPRGYFSGDNIRFSIELGGGAMMDMGCYTLNAVRYLTSSAPTEVLTTVVQPHPPAPAVDTALDVTLAFPNSATALLTMDYALPWKWIPRFPQIYVKVKCEAGEVDLSNFVMPTLYHSLRVVSTDERGKKRERVEKVYTFGDGAGKGEAWWTTYRFQLEAFVDRLRGREPQTWIHPEDSVANMEWIENVYAKSGLGSRPKSTFALPA